MCEGSVFIVPYGSIHTCTVIPSIVFLAFKKLYSISIIIVAMSIGFKEQTMVSESHFALGFTSSSVHASLQKAIVKIKPKEKVALYFFAF